MSYHELQDKTNSDLISLAYSQRERFTSIERTIVTYYENKSTLTTQHRFALIKFLLGTETYN